MQIGYVNTEKRRPPVLMSAARYMVAGNYAVAKEKLELVEHFVDYLLFLWWVFKGFAWLSTLTGYEGIGASVLFVLGFLILNMLLHLPFAWYRTFHIDKAFHFTRMTPKMFIVDQLKSLALTVVIGGALAAAMAWIIDHIAMWWLWGFILFFAVAVAANVLYPTLIAPMFNTFTPLEEGKLKERIEAMMRKSGLQSDGIYVMDAGKRDSRLNAYFGGLGKAKRVVLFDTLLEKLSDDELLAVLGHELGHFKHGDLYKNIALLGVLLFAAFYVLGHLPDSLFLQMGVAPFAGVKMATMLLLLPLMMFVFTPLLSRLSRHNEYAADAYGAQEGGKEHLINALLKLVGENKAFPKSHPLTVFFYHTHPPVLERLQALGYDAAASQEKLEKLDDYEASVDADEEKVSQEGIFAFFDKDDKPE
jgi:STE24 endopeptidase